MERGVCYIDILCLGVELLLWLDIEGLIGWNIYGGEVVDESRGSHEVGMKWLFTSWALGWGLIRRGDQRTARLVGWTA